jgi:hypothetical protein
MQVPRECWLSPSVEVGRSSIEGLGLFAARPITDSELVMRLGGQVIDGVALAALKPPYSSVALDEDAHLLIDPAHRSAMATTAATRICGRMARTPWWRAGPSPPARS